MHAIADADAVICCLFEDRLFISGLFEQTLFVVTCMQRMITGAYRAMAFLHARCLLFSVVMRGVRALIRHDAVRRLCCRPYRQYGCYDRTAALLPAAAHATDTGVCLRQAAFTVWIVFRHRRMNMAPPLRPPRVVFMVDVITPSRRARRPFSAFLPAL